MAVSTAACSNDIAPSPDIPIEEPVVVVEAVVPTVVPLETEPEPVQVEPVHENLIVGTDVGALYEVGLTGFDKKWTNPENGSYSLLLKTSDSDEWNVFYGGHGEDYASMDYGTLNFSGEETLTSFFIEHDEVGRVLQH